VQTPVLPRRRRRRRRRRMRRRKRRRGRGRGKQGGREREREKEKEKKEKKKEDLDMVKHVCNPRCSLGHIVRAYLKITTARQAPVAHTCNPSYSGGRGQEDHCSKPAQANSSQNPILKNPSQKQDW
jgi:hypothetical protein